MSLRVLLHTTAAFALTGAFIRLTTTSQLRTYTRMTTDTSPKLAEAQDASGPSGSMTGASSVAQGAAQAKEPLLLPSSEEAGDGHNLQVGGDKVVLDSLGPIVLNTDGSLSRIGNWDQMTEPERCATKRMVAKRNLARKKMLEAKEQAESV
ncbi:hypothetical protein BCR37DRAFT_382480 [Protomyces lactucae-debilis]|uniref:Uncharacterized protein n=1 Tax=Protomyces lactucae-debilis TaxID=2754530 RepID=A0A1Y2F2T4_PROLT|nr:uncharacterized protein BCR37DRAFT_382480 [Protomyces lactucae-debilis]ORY78208.1 hypothetical protein BCR37DRAFT_382480 [Protomyces lactucae-debilis]